MTTMHYSAGGTASEISFLGFDLIEVQSVNQLNALPEGSKGLVWLNEYHGVTQSFIDKVSPYIGNPKLFGFYLVDEPDPTGNWGPQATAEDLKAESDWIHTHLPGAKTFITMMNMNWSGKPDYSGTFNPANSNIDYYGVAMYPVRSEGDPIDYDMIDRAVAAALDFGIPLDRIVPVYQAFGEGIWHTDTGGTYVVPDAVELQTIFDRWASLVPSPVFDYVYHWGSQHGDVTLEDRLDLQQVFRIHNKDDTTAKHLNGNSYANNLNGGAGWDTLSGHEGNDSLHGWGGDDLLFGNLGHDFITGNNGSDVEFGNAGNDSILGGWGGDFLFGGYGADRLFGGNGNDRLDGENGNDWLGGGPGGDTLIGGPGWDRVLYNGASQGVRVDLQNPVNNTGDAAGDVYDSIEQVNGSRHNDLIGGDAQANCILGLEGNDSLQGFDQSDYLNGGSGNDKCYGGPGDDKCLGGPGDDTLVGGFGKDLLTGGSGADAFVFGNTWHSPAGPGHDVITDFHHDQGDVIDLSGIDANSGNAGNQPFHFITTGFTGTKGELLFDTGGGNGFLKGDINGDGSADLVIELAGVTSFHADDVIL